MVGDSVGPAIAWGGLGAATTRPFKDGSAALVLGILPSRELEKVSAVQRRYNAFGQQQSAAQAL